MALLHSALNIVDAIGGAYPEGSFMQRLHALASEGKSPEELAQFLNEDPELESVHG